MPGFRETFRADLRACGCRRCGFFANLYYFLTRWDYSAILFYRLASTCYGWDNRLGGLLALIFWRLNTLVNACDLRSQAVVGPGLSLPHPVGIILGYPIQIGRNATIHQNVTIGRRTTDDAEGDKMTLSIGDNVVIGAGAVIVGDVRIGNNCEIGANSVLSKDMPSDSVAIGVPARVMSRRTETAPAALVEKAASSVAKVTPLHPAEDTAPLKAA